MKQFDDMDLNTEKNESTRILQNENDSTLPKSYNFISFEKQWKRRETQNYTIKPPEDIDDSEKPQNCPNCGKIFLNKIKLYSHIASVHYRNSKNMKKLYYNLAIKLRKEAKINGKEKGEKETLDEEAIIINKEQDQELSMNKSESELKIEIAIESAIKRVNEEGIKSFVDFKIDPFVVVVDEKIEPEHQQNQSQNFLQPDDNKYYHCPACFGKGLGLTRQGFLYNCISNFGLVWLCGSWIQRSSKGYPIFQGFSPLFQGGSTPIYQAVETQDCLG